MADDLAEEDWWCVNEETEKISKKRKIKDVTAESEENQGTKKNECIKPNGKRKKKPQKKLAATKNVIDSSTLWNFFVNATKGKLSSMELDDLKPTDMDECFLNDDIEAHTSLDQLSPFLVKVIPHWSKVMQSIKQHHNGSPALLIISGSARRSVEISRAIKSFKTPPCKTAKLFAKHFKLEEQQTFLSKSHIHIGIGTPNRILKLLSDDFLKLKKLKYVIIDWNYKDPKQRRMIDIPEVKKDIVELLQQHLLHRLKEGKLKFALF